MGSSGRGGSRGQRGVRIVGSENDKKKCFCAVRGGPWSGGKGRVGGGGGSSGLPPV